MLPVTCLLIHTAHKYSKNSLAIVIYGISCILLFTASALYHYYKKAENERSIWRVIDHISIYVLIAGTYTPISYLSMSRSWWLPILSIQWGLAIVGFCLELFQLKVPRLLSTLIYVIMGWVVIIAVVPVYNGVPLSAFVLLVFAAVTYSTGAVIYALKTPNPFPGILGFHEIFHFLVLIANVTFATIIFQLLTSTI